MATLMTAPWRHMRRTVLKCNTVPQFEFRQYIFAAQVREGTYGPKAGFSQVHLSQEIPVSFRLYGPYLPLMLSLNDHCAFSVLTLHCLRVQTCGQCFIAHTQSLCSPHFKKVSVTGYMNQFIFFVLSSVSVSLATSTNFLFWF